AIIGPLLGDDAIDALKKALEKNLPGIGDKIDIDALIAHAGTIGLISAIGLLFTGLGWIDSLRVSIRSMHELDDEPGNMVKLKAVAPVDDAFRQRGQDRRGASSILTALSKR